MSLPPLKTFIIYAREDRKAVEDLRKHLALLEKKALLEVWYDGEILAGEQWDKSIKKRLEQAELLLMFISVDFINSEYIEKTELQAALQRHRDGLARLIPVIVHPCDWGEYFEIGQFQALPNQARPIFSSHFPYVQEAFHEIQQGIKRTAQDLLEKRAAQQRAEAEAAEATERRRHRQDEAAWKKVLEKLDGITDAQQRTDLLEAYRQDDAHQNHRVEAEEQIEDIRADIEAERRLEEAARKKREAEAEKQRVAQQQAEEEKHAAEAVQKQEAEQAQLGKGLEMVFVQGGSFDMGGTERESEKPIHKVTVPDFEIGKYAVTQKLWQEIMGDNPSHFKGDELPVEQVSWDDCQQFLKKLNNRFPGKNYRLPSEAEWEYAARGGQQSHNFKYAGSNHLSQVAWYAENSGDTTHPVGQKQANELNIYDLSGNVGEWCGDWYHDSYQDTPADGAAWLYPAGSYRVIRGGAWSTLLPYCRMAHRGNGNPSDRTHFLGFRLARTF